MTKITSKQRADSLKRYLDDCKAGVDTVAAWKAHKARMAGR